MIRAIFKNTFLISSLGHLLVFGLFVFSFDPGRFKSRPQPELLFWGQILPKACFDLKQEALNGGKDIPARKTDIFIPGYETAPEPPPAGVSGLKPRVDLPLISEKLPFAVSEEHILPRSALKSGPIMLHPLLPYQLQIYFKDRQAVHIELMFNIITGKGRNYVLVKRKISSGNLDADLLSLRYINHYLFIKQAGFPLNTWQTVKIDLSNKND